ncbi:MAG: drug/metabolite transporter (DMT)-like permease [Paracoccaceae bacterium]|jgi:drug/metabolite transporter (DMT)-like permease
MSLWIPITIAAAIFQTLRFMLQKTLSTTRLSASGATFARFAYSAPIIVVVLAGYLWMSGRSLPPLGAAFWGYALTGGLSQILATICVVALFKQRNFAVGITFKKTEVIQAVLVGLLILGEGVSWAGLAAILLGLTGVLTLSKNPGSDGPWWQHLTNRAAGLGLGSGVLFAISGVTYRAASLGLGDLEPVFRAGITLAAVTSSQMIGMGLWLAWRDRAELRAVWAARRTALWVGLFSMGGSFCWFVAFTLQTVAYVKALGQVELIFSMLASVLFFRERISGRELAGIGLLGVSILLLVLVA